MLVITPNDLKALSPDARELLLDVGQFTLDIVGIFEPTPFADLTSGVISLCRGDIFGGVISAIAIVPYAGDLAKLAKIPRYVHVVDEFPMTVTGKVRKVDMREESVRLLGL